MRARSGHGHRATDSILLGMASLTVALWLWTRWMAEGVAGGAGPGGHGGAAGNQPPPTELNIQPIRRIKAGEYSVKEFFDKFGDETVIVEGEVRHHPAFELGFQGLRNLCSGSLLETSVYSETSDEWAGLSNLRVMRLGEYLDRHILPAQNWSEGDPPLPGDSKASDGGGGGGNGGLRYASGGMGIPEICPRLEFFTPVPKYVSVALYPIDHFAEGHRIQQGQPEMFIGPAGTKTELHMDSMLIPFWMSVRPPRVDFSHCLPSPGRLSLNLFDE